MSTRATVLALLAWAVLASLLWSAPLDALIVDGRMNPWHDWKGTSRVLKQELEETGVFAVKFATAPPECKDPGDFRPDFRSHHVVILNYESQEEWSESTKQALVDYVRGGGGLVVYHTALSAFGKWKQYDEMVGATGWYGRNEKNGPYVYWQDGGTILDNTPGPAGSHGPMHGFQIVVRDPGHPIAKGLPEAFMHCPDELYNRLRGPAKNLTVLATALSPTDKRGTGRHEPILMAVRYGAGRVFVTTIGHGPKELKSVAFIVTFQRGAEWAATGKVTLPVPADFPGPDQPSIRNQ